MFLSRRYQKRGIKSRISEKDKQYNGKKILIKKEQKDNDQQNMIRKPWRENLGLSKTNPAKIFIILDLNS